MAFGKLGQTLTALEIFDLVREDLDKVEREIGLESISSTDAVTYIGQYLQSGGGKRLRPMLVLLSGKLFADSSPALIRMAAVVEMIHTATLVHDDVIDIAKTRRGRPSVNVVWGNHTSVLAGDWLYMQAFQVALRERSFPVLDLLISLTQMMVEGELLQLERIGKIAVTEADYMELIDRKTASLFSACARLGAIVAGASEVRRSPSGRIRLEPGHSFPTDRRHPRFHQPRKNPRQARRQRPARRQSNAAPDLRARNRRRRGTQARRNHPGRRQLRPSPVRQNPPFTQQAPRHRASPGASQRVHRKSPGHHRRVPKLAVPKSSKLRDRSGNRPRPLVGRPRHINSVFRVCPLPDCRGSMSRHA